jgi:hypothetical protein
MGKNSILPGKHLHLNSNITYSSRVRRRPVLNILEGNDLETQAPKAPTAQTTKEEILEKAKFGRKGKSGLYGGHG